MQVSIGAVAGGPIMAHFGMVDMELRKGNTVHRRAARVGFYNGGKTILGQSAFLEHFTATFNYHLRHFDLRANGTFSAPATPLP